MRKLVVPAAIAAFLAIVGTAIGWHSTPSVTCLPNGAVQAKFEYGGFPQGFTVRQQLIEIDTVIDEWKPVVDRYVQIGTPGYDTITIPQPLDGKAHTYVAKTQWEGPDRGSAKSNPPTGTPCAPLVPIKDCQGNVTPMPPGTPTPVCAPPAAPPVTPPAQPTPPVAPPKPPVTTVPPTTPPAPKCSGEYRITRSRHNGQVTLRVRDERGIKHLARWRINGEARGKHRSVTVPRAGLRIAVARTGKYGCVAQRRFAPIRPPFTG